MFFFLLGGGGAGLDYFDFPFGSFGMRLIQWNSSKPAHEK